jgi:signal peptidase
VNVKNFLKNKKTLKIISNVAFWLVLGLILTYSLTALFSKEDANMRTLFGSSALSVQSNSMSPTFVKGDLIFVDTDFELTDIKVGDVITYQQLVFTTDGKQVMIYNSHRVIGITTVSGALYFYTQGDAELPDTTPVFQTEVQGIWTGSTWKGFGTFADSFIGFIKSSVGFFLFIVLPCFLFLVYEIFRFVKVMSEYNVQKTVGDRVKIQAEALALAKAQLEAELLAREQAKSQE